MIGGLPYSTDSFPKMSLDATGSGLGTREYGPARYTV
jgi:hypothetical protein